MKPSYSSFKNDINLFDSEEYYNKLKLVDNDTSTDLSLSCKLFFEFIDYYKEIENEDLKKPIFSQTTKFKKNPNNYKNYKYAKINRDSDEIKTQWNFNNPVSETEAISVLIKSNLNKISDDTYKKISVEFINEILIIDNIQLFNILSKEIINKCLFENKYRLLYINLCSKIWTNKLIHYNFVNITNNDNLFFWSYKNSDNDTLHGPFNNENAVRTDIFNKLNFKKYFVNYIQNLYITKDLSLEDLSDEDFYKKKKQVLLLVELIGIMYLEKYINFDIINLIIIDLLHLNDNFKKIEDIEFEALYTLIKLINDAKSFKQDLSTYKNILNEFVNIIQTILDNNVISKRCEFFLKETVIMMNSINKQKTDKDNEPYVDNKAKFIDCLKKQNVKEMVSIYKKTGQNHLSDKIYFINKFIEEMISATSISSSSVLINFLIEIDDLSTIYDEIEKITNNIDDIMLDIPNANMRLIYILQNLNKYYPKKEILIQSLMNANESDSESDSESDKNSDKNSDSDSE